MALHHVGGRRLPGSRAGVHVQLADGPQKFYKIEPTPLAVDLDGDGVEELVVPQNQVREGLVAVVFKGPAGFRLQSVNTGFEGGITALGAFKTATARSRPWSRPSSASPIS